MRRVEALVFDMDGTMVDSMPWHARAWVEFARRRELAVDVPDLMRRTTGRTAYECACELMGRNVSAEEAAQITHEKETIYRELFAAEFREVSGFKRFACDAAARGLKIETGDGSLRIAQQGSVRKLVDRVEQITFSGPQALARGQQALYLTERASFRLTARGVELFELAPGVDLQHDVLDQMGFAPVISDRIETMSASHLRRMDDRFGALDSRD